MNIQRQWILIGLILASASGCAPEADPEKVEPVSISPVAPSQETGRPRLEQLAGDPKSERAKIEIERLADSEPDETWDLLQAMEVSAGREALRGQFLDRLIEHSPAEALSLLETAEDDYEIWKRFGDFTDAFAEISPEDGLSFIQRHDVGSGNYSEIKRFFKSVARSDPPAAARLFLELEPGGANNAPARAIGYSMMEHDFDEAIDWMLMIPDREPKMNAVEGGLEFLQRSKKANTEESYEKLLKHFGENEAAAKLIEASRDSELRNKGGTK